LAKFHGNVPSLSESIEKSFKGADNFDSHCRMVLTWCLTVMTRAFALRALYCWFSCRVQLFAHLLCWL